jgi:hypothetical protein
MITPIESAPTPAGGQSMPWPRPHRPAQAAPVRRESVPAGGDVPRGNGGFWGGITPLMMIGKEGLDLPFAGDVDC